MDDTRFDQALVQWAGILDARREPLPDPVRALYQRILRNFADTSEPPSPGTLRTWSTQLGIEVREALALLVTFDLVEADPSRARVRGAYPFVAQSRGHRVRLAGGPTVQAYCAIDALGIPAMLGRDVIITSHDPHTGEEVRVEVRGGRATWQPPGAVASVPTTVPTGVSGGGDGHNDRPSADVLCPTVNFYADPDAGRAYEREHGLNLEILTIPQALRAGAATFGDLLEPDSEQ